MISLNGEISHSLIDAEFIFNLFVFAKIHISSEIRFKQRQRQDIQHLRVWSMYAVDYCKMSVWVPIMEN